MDSDMLEIHPRELTFVFELQKQSSDSVQLYNNSDQYVAFKVKTTSPKKYCVRPNIGIIKPKSTCTFTVTMQPQREVPPYMQCKDKFLIQSTIIPRGTGDEEITSDLFSKSSGKYIEEKKLRVVLIEAAREVLPINGDSGKGPPEETLTQDDQASYVSDKPLPEMIYDNGGLKYPADNEASVVKHGEITPGTKIEESTPETDNSEKTVETEILRVEASHVKATEETNNVGTGSCLNAESEELEDVFANPHQKMESKSIDNTGMISNEDLEVGLITEEELTIKNDEISGQNTNKDVEAVNLKLETLNLQLIEAKSAITKLGEEQNKVTNEKEMLKQELEELRRGTNVNLGQVYDGFPLLFVCVVALVCLACGYLLRP